MGENRGVMEGTLGKVAVGIMGNMTVLVRLFGSRKVIGSTGKIAEEYLRK